AVGKNIAVGIFDDARTGGRFRFRLAFPFMAAGDAFPFFRKFQDIGHLAHRTGRFAHEETAYRVCYVIQRRVFRWWATWGRADVSDRGCPSRSVSTRRVALRNCWDFSGGALRLRQARSVNAKVAELPDAGSCIF